LIMYRSQEIIKIFDKFKLPEMITNTILELERKQLFNESIYEWLYLPKVVKEEKMKRFFYEYNNDLFIEDIHTINGNMNSLQKYSKRLSDLKIKNINDAFSLNSLRFNSTTLY